MKINLEELKALVEAGDTSAIEQHIKAEVLEKGDIKAAAEANPLVNSELDSLKDTHHSVALETWKKNHLQTLIEEEVTKRNPQETPEQKEIRELKERLDAKEKAEQRSKLREKAIEFATNKGYDIKFATKYVDRFLGDDESTTQATLDEFKTDFDAIVQVQVEEKLKGSQRNPGGGQGNGGTDLSVGAKIAQQQTKNIEEQQKAFFG